MTLQGKLEQGFYDEAIAQIQQLSRLIVGNAQLTLLRGVVYVWAGRWQEAEQG